MKFLTSVILAAFFASCSVAAHPQLKDDDVVAMADGVLFARNFMEEHLSKVKRDCGYPVDVNKDGDFDSPDCQDSDVYHCNACVDSCVNYGKAPCINAACGAGEVG
ncbi:hypothetical protein C8J57DRAFT_1506427 [Mycena rebaudengoi]|nr:hypothetical protein C8J57DRAFT_1506427 [Mycena rebaudengoi]